MSPTCVRAARAGAIAPKAALLPHCLRGDDASGGRGGGLSPNPDACLRLVSALLAEFDEEWMAGKIYLNFKI